MQLLESLKQTAMLRAWGFFKIPLIAHLRPTILDLTSERVVVKLPLTRRSKNHLGSMYFGVLATGADCAGGLIAMRLIEEKGNKVSLVFKDLHAEFLKRAEGDVVFTCNDGMAIRGLVSRALDSGERENLAI